MLWHFLLKQVCQVRYKILKKRLLNMLRRERLKSFKTEKQKVSNSNSKTGY